MSGSYKDLEHLVATRDWKVCRSCWSTAMYGGDEFACAACGGRLQFAPLYPPRQPVWTPEQWAALALSTESPGFPELRGAR